MAPTTAGSSPAGGQPCKAATVTTRAISAPLVPRLPMAAALSSPGLDPASALATRRPPAGSAGALLPPFLSPLPLSSGVTRAGEGGSASALSPARRRDAPAGFAIRRPCQQQAACTRHITKQPSQPGSQPALVAPQQASTHPSCRCPCPPCPRLAPQQAHRRRPPAAPPPRPPHSAGLQGDRGRAGGRLGGPACPTDKCQSQAGTYASATTSAQLTWRQPAVGQPEPAEQPC
jgi:hypothetical protein